MGILSYFAEKIFEEEMHKGSTPTKHTLTHSIFDEGDYIFINPRQIWRTLIGHKKFLLACVCGAMALSQIYTFFFQMPRYTSEAHLKVEAQQALSITPLFDQLGSKTQSNLKLNTIIEDFNSVSFHNSVLKNYLKSHLPVAPLLPSNRTELVGWLYGAKKQAANLEQLQNQPQWQEIVEHLKNQLSIRANFEANTIYITASTRNPQLSANLVNLASKVLLNSNYKRQVEKARQLKSFVSEQTKEKKKQLNALEQRFIDFQKKYKIGGSGEGERGTYIGYTTALEALETANRRLKIIDNMIINTEAELKKMNKNLTDPKLSNSDLYVTQLQHRMTILQYQVSLLKENKITSDDVETLEKELGQVTEQYKKAVNERNEAGSYVLARPLDYYRDLEKSLIDQKKEKTKVTLEIRALKETLAAKNTTLDTLPEVMQKFSSLKRQIQAHSDLYINLQKKFQEVEIMEAGVTNDLTLISKGTVSKKPVGLSVGLRYLVAAVGGLFLGVIALILKNTFIQTVRSFRDVQEQGITVLGEVPLIPTIYSPMVTPIARKLNRMKRKLADFSPTLESMLPNFKIISDNLGLTVTQKERQSELVVIDKPNSSEADIFRYIRLRMNSYVQDNLPQTGKGTVILVTSPTESLGKTFITTNLAASFGKGDIKTLLIDLDLRNSSVKRVFKDTQKKCGIDNLNNEGLDSENCIVKINDYFDVLFCSSKINNPTEILESHVLRDFIKKQKDKYEYIFIDSPPVLAVCDPSLLAPIVDMILLVVGYDITFKEDIQLAVEGLNTGKQRPIVGLVNMVDRGFNRYSYYYNSIGLSSPTNEPDKEKVA